MKFKLFTAYLEIVSQPFGSLIMTEEENKIKGYPERSKIQQAKNMI